MAIRPRPSAIRPQPRLGAGEPRGDPRPVRRHRCAQRVPHGNRDQGLLPRAGHRVAAGRAARGPEHLLPGHAEEAVTDGANHPRGPGRRNRSRLHRRRARRRRVPVRDAQAQAPARFQPRHHRPVAPEAGTGDRRPRIPQSGAGHAIGRPRLQQQLPIQPQGG